jgi:hypothetical protein
MPSTSIGLIILIAFLIPGFIATIFVRRRIPLFAARQSQLEIVLWGCFLSLISHILSCLITVLVCNFWSEAREIICQLSNLKLSEISPKLDNVKIGNLVLFISIYFVINSLIAAGLGSLLAIIINRTNFFIDLQSVWISAFSEKKAYFVRALLDNDYLVSGIVQWIQTDPESLISGNRDILIVSPVIIDEEGNEKDQIAEGILINTRNVKILELKTEELDKKGGGSSWLKRIMGRGKSQI